MAVNRSVVLKEVATLNPSKDDETEWLDNYEEWCESQEDEIPEAAAAPAAAGEQVAPAGNRAALVAARNERVNRIKKREIEKVLPTGLQEWLGYYKKEHADDNGGAGPNWGEIRGALVQALKDFRRSHKGREHLKWRDDMDIMSWYYTKMKGLKENTRYDWQDKMNIIMGDLPPEFQVLIAPCEQESQFPMHLAVAHERYMKNMGLQARNQVFSIATSPLTTMLEPNQPTIQELENAKRTILQSKIKPDNYEHIGHINVIDRVLNLFRNEEKLKEQPKEPPREQPKEQPKEEPKEQPKETKEDEKLLELAKTMIKKLVECKETGKCNAITTTPKRTKQPSAPPAFNPDYSNPYPMQPYQQFQQPNNFNQQNFSGRPNQRNNWKPNNRYQNNQMNYNQQNNQNYQQFRNNFQNGNQYNRNPPVDPARQAWLDDCRARNACFTCGGENHRANACLAGRSQQQFQQQFNQQKN